MTLALRRANNIALRIKHAAFGIEREWRLFAIPNMDIAPSVIKTRPTKRGIVPYLEIPLEPGGKTPKLEQLVVGPTQDQERGVRSAQLFFLLSLGYTREEVEKIVVASAAPFRG
jgi:hypothetical protein